MRYVPNIKAIIRDNTSTRYLWVSNEKGNDNNDGSFASPYATIQAAITAAEAIPATINTPVVIAVYPSTTGSVYTENLTITQQGIFLEALSADYKPDSVNLIGTITLNLSGTAGGANFVASLNNFYLRGFIVSAPDGGTALTFSGTAFQRAFLTGCVMQSGSGGPAVSLTNTGTSSGTASTMTVRDCDFSCSSASQAVLSMSSGRIFIAGANPSITNSNASGPSISITGASSLTTNNTSITGQISITSNLANITITNSSITSGTASCIVTPSTPSTGVITIGATALSSSNTNTITGSGVLVLAGNNFKTSTSGDVVSTVTQVVLPELPRGQMLWGATATAASNALLIWKNGHLKTEQTTAPTTTVNANAGTGASGSVSNATDCAGNVSLSTGTISFAVGEQLKVTFNKAYNVAPIVQLMPTNANAALKSSANSVYITSTTTTFSINFGVAETLSTDYTWNYIIIETQ